MSTKSELEKFNELDLWSIMLFALYQVKDSPEYSGISELAYILDKKNFLKLCEYFGGQTITIPTIDQLELMLYGLLMYQYVHIKNIEYEKALEMLKSDDYDARDIRFSYLRIKNTLDNYDFTSRGRI